MRRAACDMPRHGFPSICFARFRFLRDILSIAEESRICRFLLLAALCLISSLDLAYAGPIACDSDTPESVPAQISFSQRHHLEIISPLHDETVAGLYTFTAISHASNIASVEFALGSKIIGRAMAAPFSVT